MSDLQPDLQPVKRALLSVSDKTGLAEFATALHKEFGVELISTGGTARFLRDHGLPVKDVSEVTGFPEMMDGRIKTLHPKIHGGLLAVRDNAEHVAAMKQHGISAIDLVCINLYPFKETISKPGVTFEEAIENIDIGGPAMIRSAAKNHKFVLVVTSPDRYEKVLGDLREHGGACCGKHRLKQALRAFSHTAAYDTRIGDYLESVLEGRPADLSGEGGVDGSGTAQRKSVPLHGTVAIAVAEPPTPTREQADAQSPARGRLVQRLLDASTDFSTFMNDLLNMQAVVLAGTEAAAFMVERQGNDMELRLLHHIRPDESNAETRAEAVRAFQGIIKPCVLQRKDGVFDVGSPDGGDAQFCLVTVLRNEGVVVAASAVITRCRDMERAKQRLTSMQLVAGYFELYSLRLRLEPNPAPLESEKTEQSFPPALNFSLTRKQQLRYGENPHQRAALFVETPSHRELHSAYFTSTYSEASVAHANQLHGKELSYINLLDADAALCAVKEFAQPAACIVKHATPCGMAVGADIAQAFERAFAGDPLASFGGIVALNKPVDLKAANAITSIDKLLEVIVAPSYAPEALDLLKTRWKNVRLLEVGPVSPLSTQHSALSTELHMHKIVGGYLIQERDLLGIDEANWKTASKRTPTAEELADLKFAWLAVKHVKSNAIAIARDGMLLGAGAGQMDRPSAARLAIEKAGSRAKGAVAASDAFFPFPDGPKLLLDAGITAIIHPGGSLKDQETIDLIDQRGGALVLTGQRHFKH